MLVVERLLELARDHPDRAPVVVWAVNTPLGMLLLLPGVFYVLLPLFSDCEV